MADPTVSTEAHPEAAAMARGLASEWKSALAGEPRAQESWRASQGGEWVWQENGLQGTCHDYEWISVRWQRCDAPTLRALKNCVIEVTVSGEAEAAGLSFGAYQDFLVGVDAGTGARHLQLEVDVAAGDWRFRVDGRLQDRCWWDAAVRSVEDLLHGELALKARRGDQVLFQDLTIHTFEASCRLSIIVTCCRFLQRLRVSLRNWCHQSAASGSYEMLVINPDSPDGTHEHLAAIALSYPHVRLREVAVASELATNKGAMINRGVEASRGEFIWLTDADCLFSPSCVAPVIDAIRGRRRHLFYGQRRHLTTRQTAALLSGRTDGLREFDGLSASADPGAAENWPWGYTQIVHRSILEQVPYREDINHFAQSDGNFVQECQRQQIALEPIEGLVCLHLDHPFAWYGAPRCL